MDPSAIKCVYKNSFDKGGEIPMVLHTYLDRDNDDVNTRQQPTMVGSIQALENKDGRLSRDYCDLELSKQVIPQSVSKHINLFDPFHDVPTIPFLSRDSILLANIDAVFNFSHHKSGYIIKQDTKDYTFATLDDGPGNFTQYIMYRNPNSYGYGITPIEYPFDGQIDITHFNITKGELGTGDIMKEYKSFIQFVRSVEATGINVVAANYIHDEDISPLGYLVRLIVALGVVAVGGTFISKISDLDNPLMLDLLWITTRCFDKVTLFKPISTPSYDKIYYVVAQKAKINNIKWVSYLEETYSKSVKNSMTLIRLVDNLPLSFVSWVTDYNNFILLYNKYLMNEIDSGTTELYDTYKCKAIWNLPQL